MLRECCIYFSNFEKSEKDLSRPSFRTFISVRDRAMNYSCTKKEQRIREGGCECQKRTIVLATWSSATEEFSEILRKNVFLYYLFWLKRFLKFCAEAPNPSANIYVSTIVGRINLAIYCWENSRRSVLLSFGNLFILTFQARYLENLLRRERTNFLLRVLLSLFFYNWQQSTF